MDWDDQTNPFNDDDEIKNEWTPLPQQPTPMTGRKRRGGRVFAVLFILLLVFAVCVGAVYVARRVGVSLERTENGFSFSVGTRQPEKSFVSKENQPDEASGQKILPTVSENEGTQNVAPAFPPAELIVSPSSPAEQTVISSDENALSLQEIYTRVIDSVVSISSASAGSTATGTGIIMSENGYIITNHHVIEDAAAILVLTSDDQQYEAQLVGSDEASDLAVLKIEAENLQAAQFGDSSAIRVGDSVVAIGDPLGITLRGTMTNGIISAINRDLTVNDRTMTLLQTNAALNNGNSGGPLINCFGQVIGINTIKMSSYYSSATVEGLGFAIPISNAKPIIDELIENGYVSGRPAIGIVSDTLPIAFLIYYKLPSGVYIMSVVPGSDAESKGLSKGDIITAINGTEVTGIEELNTVKNQFVAGDYVTLTIYRSGSYYDINVRLIDQATGK